MYQSTTSKARYSRHNPTSHLRQALFGVEFRISGVGIWVLVGTNLRQWVWLHQYGQGRWLTYMRAYSPRWNCNSVLVMSMNISIKFSRVVCPPIELFFRVRTRLGQWFSRELIRDECIRTRLTFAAQSEFGALVKLLTQPCSYSKQLN